MSKKKSMKAEKKMNGLIRNTFDYLMNHPGGIKREASFRKYYAQNESCIYNHLNY